MTSVMFIIAAVALGMLLRYCKLNKWINTIIAIGMLVLCIVIGLWCPIYFTTGFWHIFVFIYIAIASIVPVWALLQPRDYLNSFLLIAMIGAAVVGVILFNPQMNLKAFNGWSVDGNMMFPYLFVTIACGAVSGFHALVSSGTASKQIKNEKDILPVSFGAMLLESMLAVIALIAVGYLAVDGNAPTGMTQPQVFASAVATFLTKLSIPEKISNTLITLSVSAFALTSLDSVARVGRIAFQEFFLDSSIEDEKMSLFLKVMTSKYFSTGITLMVAYALAKVGYASIWPLFGSANQLLSALALIACAVFLKKTNRQGFMLWGPMVIMLGVTLTALAMTIYSKANALMTGSSQSVAGDVLQLLFAIALIILGVIVAIQGFQKLVGDQNKEAGKAEA